MGEMVELEQKIIQLKLEKRDLVLAGKNTNKIDEQIERVEKQLDFILETIK